MPNPRDDAWEPVLDNPSEQGPFDVLFSRDPNDALSTDSHLWDDDGFGSPEEFAGD